MSRKRAAEEPGEWRREHDAEPDQRADRGPGEEAECQHAQHFVWGKSLARPEHEDAEDAHGGEKHDALGPGDGGWRPLGNHVADDWIAADGDDVDQRT